MYMLFTVKRAKKTVIIILALFVFYAILKTSTMAIHNTMTDTNNSKVDWNGHFDQFRPTENGYSVLVDLDNMLLFLYEDALEIKSWPVSGGSKEDPSPTGNWEVTGIGNWGSGFGGSWIALNVPWGIYGIHGTVEPWALGKYNISHGCIRMNNEDVAALKVYLSIGVPVHIKQDNAPFRILKDGYVGSDVLLLQMMLMELNYFNSEPDGVFGEETYEVVCQFQADENITVDGTVGSESWYRVLEKIEILNSS